eukprot:3885903-Pyramimonas_sp.AAC.1
MSEDSVAFDPTTSRKLVQCRLHIVCNRGETIALCIFNISAITISTHTGVADDLCVLYGLQLRD